MKNYEQYILEQKESFQQERLRLEERGCADEAAFAQIRANICDAFLAVWRTVGIASPDTYRQKLREIPSHWEKRRQTAASFGDEKTVMIEGIKLDTARMLSEEFERRMQEGTL